MKHACISALGLLATVLLLAGSASCDPPMNIGSPGRSGMAPGQSGMAQSNLAASFTGGGSGGGGGIMLPTAIQPPTLGTSFTGAGTGKPTNIQPPTLPSFTGAGTGTLTNIFDKGDNRRPHDNGPPKDTHNDDKDRGHHDEKDHHHEEDHKKPIVVVAHAPPPPPPVVKKVVIIIKPPPKKEEEIPECDEQIADVCCNKKDYCDWNTYAYPDNKKPPQFCEVEVKAINVKKKMKMDLCQYPPMVWESEDKSFVCKCPEEEKPCEKCSDCQSYSSSGASASSYASASSSSSSGGYGK